MDNRVLILGLGNLVLSDDAFGPLAVRFLQDNLGRGHQGVSYKENYSGGLDLLDDIQGFKKLIIVDSIVTGNEKPGTLFNVGLDGLKGMTLDRLVSSHGLNLTTVLEFGRKCGYVMPDDVEIFAVEADDCESFCEELTPAVSDSLPELLGEVKQVLNKWDCN